MNTALPPKLCRVVAAVLIGTAVAMPASAQAGEPTADQCQPCDHWNALASDGTEYVAADTFSPQADSVVSHVDWSGAYLSGTENCDPGDADAFEITYYDGAAHPGSIVAGPFSQAAGTLTVAGPTATGEFLLDEVPEYAYQATHAAVPVLADQCYWIEIRNVRADGCAWYWAVAEPADRMAIHARGAGEMPGGYDQLDLVSADMAFCLDAAMVAASSCGVPPANDTCEGRYAVLDGAHPFSTIAATGAHFFDYYSYCHLAVGDYELHRDIWYEYVPACTAMLRIDVCDADFDSKIAVLEYENRCPDPRYGTSPVACNDDGCGHEASGLDGLCYTYPAAVWEPCWEWQCRLRVRGVDPGCRYWPWAPRCDALAEALCVKPADVQSDVMALVIEGRTYLISLGGYSDEDLYTTEGTPECRARVCRAELLRRILGLRLSVHSPRPLLWRDRQRHAQRRPRRAAAGAYQPPPLPGLSRLLYRALRHGAL